MKFIGALLSIVILAGCGGSVAPMASNPLAGSYIGTFLASDGHKGHASIHLAENGTVAGSLTDASGTPGMILGTADNSLFLTGIVKFPGSADTVTGTFKPSADKVVGDMENASGYSIAIEMDRAPDFLR